MSASAVDTFASSPASEVHPSVLGRRVHHSCGPDPSLRTGTTHWSLCEETWVLHFGEESVGFSGSLSLILCSWWKGCFSSSSGYDRLTDFGEPSLTPISLSPFPRQCGWVQCVSSGWRHAGPAPEGGSAHGDFPICLLRLPVPLVLILLFGPFL